MEDELLRGSESDRVNLQMRLDAPRCAGEPFQLPWLCVAHLQTAILDLLSACYRPFIEHGVPRPLCVTASTCCRPPSPNTCSKICCFSEGIRAVTGSRHLSRSKWLGNRMTGCHWHGDVSGRLLCTVLSRYVSGFW